MYIYIYIHNLARLSPLRRNKEAFQNKTTFCFRIVPNRANRTEPNRTEPSQTEPNRTKANRTGTKRSIQFGSDRFDSVRIGSEPSATIRATLSGVCVGNVIWLMTPSSIICATLSGGQLAVSLLFKKYEENKSKHLKSILLFFATLFIGLSDLLGLQISKMMRLIALKRPKHPKVA